MAVSVFPTPSSSSGSVPNWQLVSTQTPSGVATVTFSGLAGYSKYRIMTSGLTSVGGGYLTFRVNGDTAAKYTYINLGSNGSALSVNTLLTGPDTSCQVGYADTANPGTMCVEIDNALVVAPKEIFIGAWNRPGAQTFMPGGGSYAGTSLITSLTVFTATNFNAGSIHLLGAN
jgi:hypothetical protein